MAGEGDEADGPRTEASQATGTDRLLNQGIVPRAQPLNVSLPAPTTQESSRVPSTPQRPTHHEMGVEPGHLGSRGGGCTSGSHPQT